MDKIKREGFEFAISVNGIEHLIVSNLNFDAALEFAKIKSIKNLQLNFCNNISTNNLNFLKKYNFFEDVQIVMDKAIDIDGIYYLKNLRSISLMDELNNIIDLSRFSLLSECHAFWSNSLNIDKCISLERLVLYKFGEHDLQSICMLKKLEELELINSRKIVSLRGLNMIKGLRRLSLFILPNLEEFDPLKELKQLEYLQIETCKKMKTLNFLENLLRLTTLRINECGEIYSLKEISNLKKLQDIWIRNTKILDGDLSSLVGRQNAYCTNYKGHSHTWQQLKALSQ